MHDLACLFYQLHHSTLTYPLPFTGIAKLLKVIRFFLQALCLCCHHFGFSLRPLPPSIFSFRFMSLRSEFLGAIKKKNPFSFLQWFSQHYLVVLSITCQALVSLGEESLSGPPEPSSTSGLRTLMASVTFPLKHSFQL